MRAFVSVLLVCVSLWVLETARAGVEITRATASGTPVTTYAVAGATGPHVVVAHGFAGSSQMMQGYTLPLARAGYRVHAFDFLGHGRHQDPMSGDLNAIDGTTQRLVAQTLAVIDSLEEAGPPVALLGHSMATDVLVRAARASDRVGPIVLLSAFSQEIDGQFPQDLLLLVGAWEPGLREFASEALTMVGGDAEATGTIAQGNVVRRTVILPYIEHVSILQSAAGRAEAVAWFDRAYGRVSDIRIWPTGPALAAMLFGFVLGFGVLARRIPQVDVPAAYLSRRQMVAVLLLPVVLTPPLAVFGNPGIMPVLVADYLALHLLIYGAIQLGMLRYWRVPLGPLSTVGFVLLLGAVAVLALVLDRYAANFWPTGSRFWIIALMAIGAIIFFTADARLSHRSPRRQRVMIHGAFLASLLIAVVLDFAGLFFLLMIAPVVVLFYLLFGTMGHAISNRAGPLAPGLALGLTLAWALGVSFPLFQV